MSQQDRKAQEGEVVRRLTIGASAAALGLAWYFTSSAATAVPVVLGAQPGAAAQPPAAGAEQLDDRVFVRTVHVPVIRASAGGVRAATGQAAATARASSGVQAATPSAAGTGSASASQPVPASAAAPPPTPAPAPTAATGGSKPK